MIARRLSVDALPQVAAGLAATVALLAMVAFAATGRTADAIAAGAGIGILPLAAYVAIVVEPAITATLALTLTVFAGNWHNMGVPVPLDRLTWIAALAALFWRALRGDDRFSGFFVRKVHLVLLIALAYAVCSSALAGTLTTSESIVGLLDKFGVVPFLLFFFAPVVYRTEKQRNYLVIGLVALGLYLGLTAWAEGVSATSLVFPRYILNPNIGAHYGRARGPFLEAAANGLALYVCAVAAMIGLRTWHSRQARFIAGFVSLLCVSSVLFTLTREAWLGAALATVVIIVVAPDLRRYLVPGVAAGTVLVVVAFLAIPSLSGNASHRLDYQSSIWDRLNSDSAGLKMLQARPVLGFGWSTYAERVGPYYRLNPAYPLTTVGAIHNEFLSNLVELGAVGTAIWLLGMLLAIGSPILRRGPPGPRQLWWAALVGVFVCWFVVANFTPQDYAFDNAVLWLIAGVVYSMTPGLNRSSACSHA